MKSKIINAFIAATALALSAGTAGAVTMLTLDTGPSVQQTLDHPCVIGNASCNNGALPYTLLPSGASSYDSLSPVYDVGTLQGILGSNWFNVGIDINQSGTPQTLSEFQMYRTDASGTILETLFAYLPGSPTPVPSMNNGLGWSDYMLKTLSFAGLSSTDHVMFHVNMPYVNDGREEFFLSAAMAPVPIPATGLLLLGALGSAGLFRRRRKG